MAHLQHTARVSCAAATIIACGWCRSQESAAAPGGVQTAVAVAIIDVHNRLSLDAVLHIRRRTRVWNILRHRWRGWQVAHTSKIRGGRGAKKEGTVGTPHSSTKKGLLPKSVSP